MEKMKLVEAVNWISKTVLQENLPILDSLKTRLLADSVATEIPLMDYDLYVEVEQTWGVSASLNINVRMDFDKNRSDKNGVEHLYVRCQMNWSSMYRSLTTAQAVIALYQRLTNLGCLVQSRFDGVDIYIG
jgi:hypothetical protein